MFVITAIDGHSIRNDRSLSSASATRYSPRPSRALLPNARNLPPMTASGSRPPRASTERNHRRRGRLAVGAGDGDREPHAHQLREHLGAWNDRDAPSRGLSDLGVRGPHGGRHHHDVGVADIAFGVSLGTPSRRHFAAVVQSVPILSCPNRSPRTRGSRAARRCRSCPPHRCPQSEFAGSYRANDVASVLAFQVPSSRFGVGPESGAVHVASPASASTRSTMTRAASGRASRRAASPTCRRSSAFSANATISAANRSPESSR